MSKRFTKIICAILSAVVALGILLVAGCTTGHTDTPLGGDGIFTSDNAVSNGGFTVEKGNYIYFINGVENNSATNDYGTPVKGSVNRISKEDFAARNYSKTDVVVPQIAYSGNHNGGIFVYGDRIYYGTPSTAKNAEGAVQNSNLEMQSTKLDRSVTSAPYVTFSDASYEYRYVEVDGTVYLLYVATSESLYSESTGVTNLHSVNTKTGKNTLLAYNVSSVMFDGVDKTNPRVYYTMNVRNYAKGADETYNQIYTVTADKTEANEYDTSSIIGWDKDSDRYINCGDLVFEGIGGKTLKKTPFNFEPDNEASMNDSQYTYGLSAYQNGVLILTRKDEIISEYLYAYYEDDAQLKAANPVTRNELLDNKELLKSGASASSYKYIIENGEVKAVLNAESNGGISINYVTDGKLNETKSGNDGSRYFDIVKDGTATLLFIDSEVDKSYLYYSLSGSSDSDAYSANGRSIYRVDYTGSVLQYAVWKPEADAYSPVQLVNLDAVSDWYMPEIIENQLLFPAAFSDMTLYTYVMAFDLRNSSGKPMANEELRLLKKQYKSIETTINTYADSDNYPTAQYNNIQNAINFAFYTGDSDYIKTHQKKVNANLEENADPVLSDETLAEYAEFLNPVETGKWGKFIQSVKDNGFLESRKVNGEDVYANRRDYYYSLLGKMSSGDKSDYRESLISTYLPKYDEVTQTWWESIGTVGRVFFIIGMCLIGLIVIGGATVLVIFLVKRKKRGDTPAKRRRIKVDTTDDKSIDVYNN